LNFKAFSLKLHTLIDVEIQKFVNNEFDFEYGGLQITKGFLR
jgi:hypothetical protein